MEVAIGKAHLEAIYDATPLDGYTHTIQVDSNLVGASDKKFYPRQLSGICGRDFPDRCELIFSSFKSGFRNIYYMRIHKLRGICNVSLTVSFDFSKWDLPESLGSFVDRFTAAVLKDSLFCGAVSSKCDYGFDIDCSVPINDFEDVFSKISEAEAKLESLYRKHLVPAADLTSVKYGEERMHWWIRYVFVPIICSSTIAAVIARYLLK